MKVLTQGLLKRMLVALLVHVNSNGVGIASVAFIWESMHLSLYLFTPCTRGCPGEAAQSFGGK